MTQTLERLRALSAEMRERARRALNPSAQVVLREYADEIDAIAGQEGAEREPEPSALAEKPDKS